MLSIAMALIAHVAGAAPVREESFVLEGRAEVVAAIQAACPGCDWSRRGEEAAVLELRLDGRYSQHLFLTRGAEASEYPVALGRLEAGPHRLSIFLDQRRSARRTRQASVTEVRISPFDAASTDSRWRAHSPYLQARPNTLGRFTDVPLVLWVETAPLPAGSVRLRYSVVFSNEDGGTPPDRLMATWGRLTDIEFVYGVDLDPMGRVLAERIQGPGHQLLPFSGSREGDHPVLYVVTDNNMVSDRGRTTQRFAPAAVPFDLAGTSREAVMDAAPWTYAVSAREARREGHIHEGARPGSTRLPDPRRFATLEACAETRDATIAFSLGLRNRNGTLRWFDSDGGLPAFRIGRRATEFPNGCFRGAVALPAGTAAEAVAALRFRAFTRIAGKDERPLPKGTGRAVLRRVNRLFLLDNDDQPGPSLFSWQGEELLLPEGPAFEIGIRE